VGCTQIPLMGMIGESIGAVLLSRMSELRHQGRPREILLLAARAMRKLAFVYLPVFALLLVVGHDFLILMFTRKYEASWPIFAVNLCMLPLLILVTDPIIRAYADQPYYLLRVRAVTLVLQVVILVIAVRSIGMTGAIVTLLGISIIERSAVTLRIASVIGMKASDLSLFADIGRIAIVSLICGIVTYLVRSMLGAIHPFLALIICGGVFASVFSAFVIRLRLLEPDEKNFIQRHLRRLALRLPFSAGHASAGVRCSGAD
jgi:O-antigen/teichoic acid export membrane protein